MGMNCKRAGLLLSRHLDKELSESGRLALNQHLESCRACRLQLSEYDSLNRLLAPPEPINAPLSLSADVLRRIHLERSGRVSKVVPLWFRLRPVLIPLSGAVLVVVALFTAGELGKTLKHDFRMAEVKSLNEPEQVAPVFQQEISADSLKDDTTNEYR